MYVLNIFNLKLSKNKIFNICKNSRDGLYKFYYLYNLEKLGFNLLTKIAKCGIFLLINQTIMSNKFLVEKVICEYGRN